MLHSETRLRKCNNKKAIADKGSIAICTNSACARSHSGFDCINFNSQLFFRRSLVNFTTIVIYVKNPCETFYSEVPIAPKRPLLCPKNL